MNQSARRVFLSGIGGIGMANFAALLQEAGFVVAGSDGVVYEPAATILRERGITILSPYSADNIPRDGTPVILGNALSRGNPEVEAVLNLRVPLFSFPDFLHRTILQGRDPIVVAGTHGKSTTTACIAHLLQTANLNPGFLVGALPLNFPVGAQWGGKIAPFVVEGDEYDSAFFDKRSKFLSYFPKVLVLGPVEYDHADIFSSESEMLLSYRRLIRILPTNGMLIYYADCPSASALAAAAPCPTMSVGISESAEWRLLAGAPGTIRFQHPDGQNEWKVSLIGRHNRLNLLMSLSASQLLTGSIASLRRGAETFRGLRRRMEVLFADKRLVIIDDFAHHPTAIRSALEAVRETYAGHRVIAILEPRSNTMVRNVFQHELAKALATADEVIVGTIHRRDRIPEGERLDAKRLRNDLTTHGVPMRVCDNEDIPARLQSLLDTRPTAVVFMSNGSFDGVPQQFVRLISTSS
ncbi:MAG: Mur ligase domain-containing protein [bacterium]|nr:Mur ligase domain-containing protein [bacterium]